MALGLADEFFTSTPTNQPRSIAPEANDMLSLRPKQLSHDTGQLAFISCSSFAHV